MAAVVDWAGLVLVVGAILWVATWFPPEPPRGG